MNSIYGNQSKPFNNYQFWVRRLARIYPLWVIFLIFQFILFMTMNLGGIPIAKNSIGDGKILENSMMILILTLTFALWISPNLWNTIIPGGWSIQAEVLNYLFFSFFRKQRYFCIIIFGALNFMTRNITYKPNQPDIAFMGSTEQFLGYFLNYLCISTTFSFFLLGAICHGLITTKERKNIFDILTFLFLLISILFGSLPFGNTSEAIIFIFLSCLLTHFAMKLRVAELILGKIGKVSYFMYFAHFYVLIIIRKFHEFFGFTNGGSFEIYGYFFIYLMLCLTTCYLLGLLSFHFFENPIIKFARSK